jgi:hypothetical protein
MDAAVAQTFIRWRAAVRLVASRYPTAGLFDRIAKPADIDSLIELEGWTNDRIMGELGILHAVPRNEWVTGRPMDSVIMAAFCHPHPGGGRFNGEERGAWYAAHTLETALAESIYHRSQELQEVGGFETRVQMRVYLADFSARFHDVRAPAPGGRRRAFWNALYDSTNYRTSQQLGRQLLESGSNGIIYRSVRHTSGECLACFRPRLIRNVRAGGHYEYRWEGSLEPIVRRL